MGTIQRSVVLDACKVFVATAAVALLLMTLGGGAKEGVSRGLPPQLIVRIMPYLVPEMLRFVVPGCLLFAICSVYGRMAASNEVVAIKSLGINPLRVMWPAFVLAYALSMFTYWLYDVCAVWARPNLQREVAQSLAEIAYGYLRANRSFRTQGLSIVVKGVEGDQLQKPIVTIDSSAGGRRVVLIADRARLRSNPQAGILRLECENGRLEVSGKASLSFADRFVHDIALSGFHPPSEDELSPAALGMRALREQAEKERSHIARLETSLGEQATGRPQAAEPARAELSFRQHRLSRLVAEPHRRLSNGLGCLCFALVGVPVAVGRRSADVMSIFFICFLPILLLYYPLLMTGENLARQGVFPQGSVWLADATLLIVGAVLMWRSTRR